MATVKNYKGFYMVHLGRTLFQVNCPDGTKFRYGFHKKIPPRIRISTEESEFIDKKEITLLDVLKVWRWDIFAPKKETPPPAPITSEPEIRM